MNAEEEEERARQAAAGMEDFMKRLATAVEQQQRAQKNPDKKWDEPD